MKSIFFIRPKIRIALALLAMVLVLLGGVLMERHFFSKINTASSSIYKDRLLPATAVYHLSDHMAQRRFALEDYFEENSLSQEEVKKRVHRDKLKMDSIITAFEKTYLVQDETQSLNLLKQHLHRYSITETEMLEAGDAEVHQAGICQLSVQYHRIRADLAELSYIQTMVGQRLFSESQSVTAQAGAVSYLQVAVLIITCFLVQMFIMASKAISSPLKQKHFLN